MNLVVMSNLYQSLLLEAMKPQVGVTKYVENGEGVEQGQLMETPPSISKSAVT